MKNTRTIKTLTLSCFCLLLASFIAYKSGFLDKKLSRQTARQFNQTDTQIVNQTIKKDSLPTTSDSARFNPGMLPTSKSLILIDQKMEFPKKDSSKKTRVKSKPKN